jgi:hypothetical protein
LEYTNIIAFWEQILKSNVETTMATESSIFWSVEVKEEFVNKGSLVLDLQEGMQGIGKQEAGGAFKVLSLKLLHIGSEN